MEMNLNVGQEAVGLEEKKFIGLVELKTPSSRFLTSSSKYNE